MPFFVPPVADEREGLLAFLAQQRAGIVTTAFGLTDDQARLTPTAGALSIGGLLKHIADTEESWIDRVLQHDRFATMEERIAAYQDQFELLPHETVAGAIRRYEEVAARTEAEIAAIADLGQPVPVPPGVPWFPKDVEAWSVRWVLLHLIEETARHAGHADIVRESIDGATTYPLVAAAEGWPETDWLTPWKPAGSP